jgi:RNA polymerase sigma-70 factor (ECF subfamily)
MDQSISSDTDEAKFPLTDEGRLAENQIDFDDEVLSALREISDVARMCLLLRVVQQLSYDDIAQTLHIPAGTAMSHVHRAKQSIRERLKDRDKESSKYCGHEGNVR